MPDNEMLEKVKQAIKDKVYQKHYHDNVVCEVLSKGAAQAALQAIAAEWTDDAPTVPGWYWHRNPPLHEEQIVLVSLAEYDGSLGFYWFDSEDEYNWRIVESLTSGQWSGPINPPEGS